MVAENTPEQYEGKQDELAENTLENIETIYQLCLKDIKAMKMFLHCLFDLVCLFSYRNKKFQNYEVKFLEYAAKFFGIIVRNLNWKDDMVILDSIIPEEKDALSIFLKMINATEHFE